MDRLSLAEAALAAAARHGAVIVPDRVTSPMDCCRTVPVARAVVDRCADRARHDAAEWVGAGFDPATVEAVVDPEHPTGRLLDPEMIRLAGGELPPSTASRSA
jgi:hypothetical protein